VKLSVAKILLPLDLGGYADAMSGQIVYVWVNPTRDVLRKRDALISDYNADAKDQEAFSAFMRGIDDWFATLWSQHPDASTHWTAQELAELLEADPVLYTWMKDSTIEMLQSHRRREKKE
jgi:hypothetical protein